jgi:hypothetical protein
MSGKKKEKREAREDGAAAEEGLAIRDQRTATEIGRRRKSESTTPAASITEITKKQKESLIETIEEANRNELKRQERLSKAVSLERIEELRKRHDKERSSDQQRIKNLVQDLESLQNISVEEKRYFSKRSAEMTAASSSRGGISTMNVQRMPGELTHEFYREEYNKMQHIDRRAAHKGDRFDEYAEKRKVTLLPPLHPPSLLLTRLPLPLSS